MVLPERLKVLFFRPSLSQGGADRVTLTLLQELDREVFAPSLVLIHRQGEHLEDIPSDVPVHVLEANSLWSVLRPLTKLLRETQPAVLFSTSSGTNVPSILAARLARHQGRVVLSERNVLLHGQFTPPKQLMLWLKKLLYGQADLITSVSEGVRQDVIRRTGVASEKVFTVYNPVVNETLKTQVADLVEHPWFQEEVPIIMGMGRLVEEKDFGILLLAFAEVRRKRPARLLILGEGPLREPLTRQAASLGIAEDVAMPGFDLNPFRYLVRCTVFVLSSRFEGLPGALIQAMACGAPAISTDCPSGPSEIITPNQTGLLVPVGDVQAMAGSLRYVLDHPAEAAQMGSAGKLAVQRFSSEKVIRNYEAALLGQVPVAPSLLT